MMLATAKRLRLPLSLAARACLASSCAPVAGGGLFERCFRRRARRVPGFLAAANRADVGVLIGDVTARGRAETKVDG